MKTLTVALPGREYNIQIGWGLLTRAGEELRAVLPGASRIFVVTDSHVAPLYRERVRASLEGAGFRVTAHTVPAGEDWQQRYLSLRQSLQALLEENPAQI